MRAAVQLGVAEPLLLADVAVDAPGPREVLVRTAAAGVCHSDAFALEGRFPFPVPSVMGHESAGIVEAVGSEVTYVAPGDHVTTCLSVFCGDCDMCVSGRPYLCDKQGTRRRAGEPPRLRLDGEPVHAFEELGSFAEQLLVHEHAVVRIDPAMPLEVAALLGCGVTTGLGAVLNTARVPAGASVAVVGCGGVGLSAVQAARICGATRIVAVDTRASKLALARELGATDASTRPRATPSSRSSSSPAAGSSGPSRRSAPPRRPSRRSACCARAGPARWSACSRARPSASTASP